MSASLAGIPRRVAVVGVSGALRDYITGAFRMPLLGSVLVGSALAEAGYEVRVFCESVRALNRADLRWIATCDVVCVGALTSAANRAYALACEVRALNPRAVLVLGDVHGAVMPSYSLDFFDYVFRGEGEVGLLELLVALASGASLECISGLSWRASDGQIHHNPDARRGALEGRANHGLVEGLHHSDRMLVARERRKNLAVLQASRGCPVACSFCLGSAILGRKYRKREIDDVIADLRHLRDWGGGERRNVFFVDNNLFVDLKYSAELLRRIIDERFNFSFIGFAQYQIGRVPEVLDLIREAGFIRVFMGFESINPKTIHQFRKPQRLDEMWECIRACHDRGVSIHGSFMFGADTDTYELIDETVQFAIASEITTASFFSLTEYPFEQYPGRPSVGVLDTPRLLSDDLDHYNSNFVTFLPHLMRPSRLQRRLVQAYERFFSPWRALKGLAAGKRLDAYHRFAGWLGSRGLMSQMRRHVRWLEHREQGYYDDRDRLDLTRSPPVMGSLVWSGARHYSHLTRSGHPD